MFIVDYTLVDEFDQPEPAAQTYVWLYIFTLNAADTVEYRDAQ